MKKGFTLIELLVVVLIIGILAAVGLPQYEMAVEKSRAAKAIAAARTIKNAEEVYYMANGIYTDDMNDLDVEVGEIEGFLMYLVPSASNAESKVQFDRQSTEFPYDIIFGFDYRTSNKGIAYCAAPVSSAKANRLCAGYGDMFLEDSNYKRYRLN